MISKRRLVGSAVAVAVALAPLSTAATAGAAARGQRLKLHTALFAAQVGSTGSGGSVYAGAVVDPRVGHGAAVFSTNGATKVRITFHEYFALGSISGSGNVTLVTNADGTATLTGSLKIGGGTAKFAHAKGRLTVVGTIDKAGVVNASVDGTVGY